MKRFGNRGASLVEYALLVGIITVVCIAAVTLLGKAANDGGCDINYGVAGGSVHLRMEGGGCLRSSVNAIGEDTNVILSIDPENNAGTGVVQSSFPAGTVYNFTIHYVDSDGQDIIRQIEDVREGDSDEFSA